MTDSATATSAYQLVVGLEVHVQLLTRTKLFCGCRNQFGLPPNTATCPVCLGLPGALPVMNQQAFRLALRAALALNCTIAQHPHYPPGFTKWDRKNYYYPDLPKNYQISQYDLPFAHDGWLEINAAADPKKEFVPQRIGIIRVHLEEDAGKNLHDESGRGGESLVDLNRAGTPLLEIVTRPDITSADHAVTFLEEIRLLLREIGVSDCEMQEGSLRCDANVNIHVPDPHEATGYAATPIVEIKNLNSFRAVRRALLYEGRRQYEQYRQQPQQYRFGKLLKTTAGWDDARGVTVVQRHKEEAADYRYFPEPDLVPVVVPEQWLQEVRAEMGELPQQQRQRLIRQYGLTAYDAQVLTAKGRAMVAYFEEVAALVGDGRLAANRISDLVYPALAERKEDIHAFPIRPAAFAEFLRQAPDNSQDRRDVFAIMLRDGVDVAEAKRRAGIKQWDEATLRQAVQQAIAGNPKAVADYKKGKETAKMAIVGAVMKANKGAPNDLVRRLIDEALSHM
jgi:aspartyl-tRNA(Asn)/glutamyl-tRNA(Gln) amidotransferase subunit B